MPGSRESSEAPAARDPRPGPGESAPAPLNSGALGLIRALVELADAQREFIRAYEEDRTSEDRADPVEAE